MRKQGWIAVCAVLAAGVLTGACTERAYELWNQPHAAEGEGFGDTNRHIMAQQVVDPDPVNPTAEDAAVDGRVVGKAVTSYKNREVSLGGTGGGGGRGGGGGGGGTTSVAVPAK